jgi:hypothetical protein
VEINIKEVEATVLNLGPGDVLAVKLKGEEFLNYETIQSLSDQMKLLFPNNKVIVLSMNDEHDIQFDIINAMPSTKAKCGPISYCEGCDCGKKEMAESLKNGGNDEQS